MSCQHSAELKTGLHGDEHNEGKGTPAGSGVKQSDAFSGQLARRPAEEDCRQAQPDKKELAPHPPRTQKKMRIR